MITAPAAVSATSPIEPASAARADYRLDIQLVRAFAIILVLLHHAHVPKISGGFLGVDVFFVISGYLMTSIIARGLGGQGHFSFRHFYARRIRRLLPAAYATLIVTALLSAVLLDPDENSGFLWQLIGSFGFFANFVLWKQAEYFDQGAALKPLLHMWSLAIEEQYYLVLPWLMFLTPVRWRLPIGVALALGSGFLGAYFLERNPSAVFYLLPFRAWELGIGSILALAVRQELIRPAPMGLARAAAVMVLLAVPLLSDERNHPGLPALVICLATALLLIPGLELRTSPLLRPFAAIGDRSYSLYLVHWPPLALATNIMLYEPSLAVNLMLIVVALIWAELQYRFVEQPLRTMRVDRRTLFALVLVPLIVVAAAFAYGARPGNPPMPERAANFGLSRACNIQGAFTFPVACSTGANPAVLVWGDSFAMQLLPGMAESSVPVAQATRVVCGPFTGIAPLDGVIRTRTWAEKCIAFNESVLAALARAPQVKTVVLASSLVQYLPEAESVQILSREPDDYHIKSPSRALLTASLQRTVTRLRQLGKRVVLVAPPPTAGFDIGRCQARQAAGLPIVPAVADCTFSERSYLHLRAPNLKFLADVERQALVPVFRFDPLLCENGRCQVTSGSTLLYRDAGHLSISGSRLIGRENHLTEQLVRLAW